MSLPGRDTGGRSQLFLFALMCLIWGTTWLATKVGVAAVPPILFAGTRFTAAGLLLLVGCRIGSGPIRLARTDLPRVVVVSLLSVSVTYSLLFWALQHVSSGLGAVINLSLMPVGLLAFGLAHGEERFSPRMAGAVALGVAGLAILFLPSSTGTDSPLAAWAALAVVVGTLAYAWGSVLGRPLLRAYPPVLLSGVENLLGGLVLLLLAFLLEPVNGGVLAAFLRPPVLLSWAGLVLFGSLVAYTVYLRLLRDWGAARAGMYAFVSPVIAVALGVGLLGEALRPTDIIAIPIMLGAAWLALRRADPPAQPADAVMPDRA